MSVRTVIEFYRAYWLSLTLCFVVLGVYFASALAHGDYRYVVAGAITLAAVVGLLWGRHRQ